MVLVGRTASCDGETVRFDADLGENIAHGDATYLSLFDEADAYVADTGLDLPEEPEARELGPLPACAAARSRSSISLTPGSRPSIWATGFAVDYSWLAGRRFRRDRPAAPPARRVV